MASATICSSYHSVINPPPLPELFWWPDDKRCLLNFEILATPLKGAGGSEVDFHFLIVSNRGACQLPGTFFRMKKSCS